MGTLSRSLRTHGRGEGRRAGPGTCRHVAGFGACQQPFDHIRSRLHHRGVAEQASDERRVPTRRCSSVRAVHCHVPGSDPPRARADGRKGYRRRSAVLPAKPLRCGAYSRHVGRAGYGGSAVGRLTGRALQRRRCREHPARWRSERRIYHRATPLRTRNQTGARGAGWRADGARAWRGQLCDRRPLDRRLRSDLLCSRRARRPLPRRPRWLARCRPKGRGRTALQRVRVCARARRYRWSAPRVNSGLAARYSTPSVNGIRARASQLRDWLRAPWNVLE